MDITLFIQKIEEEFPDIQAGSLRPETKFREQMEWDSINALVFIALVNVTYDVSITAEELIQSETVADVYQIVQQKVQAKEAN